MSRPKAWAGAAVDPEGVIIAGQGRFEAAKSRRQGDVPVIVIGGLSEAQRRAYQIADNRIPLDAAWDEALLAEVLPEIDDASLDLVLTGFSDDELRSLLDDIAPEQAVLEWSLREHASPPRERERLETTWTKLSRDEAIEDVAPPPRPSPVDVPLAGLRIAARRAARDGLDGACWIGLADGAALPFRSGCFDALSHSDVLCCLDAKLPVLRACRRVIRSGGRMVFSVISVAPGLSSADHERAVESGPPFVEAPGTYPTMLRQAGWEITDRVDLTAKYAETTRRLLREEESAVRILSNAIVCSCEGLFLDITA